MRSTLPYLLALSFTGPALADVVIMRDGSVRYGTVETHDSQAVRFRMERDGITSVAMIPVPQISRIILGPAAPPGTAVTAVTPPEAPVATPAPTVPVAPAVDTPPPPVPSASQTELVVYQSRGFLRELAASSLGKGPADIQRLPAADRELWEQAVKADVAGQRADALEALRSLEAAMHDLPDGLVRLDTIAQHERQETFGTWMARLHWDLLHRKFSTGQFDLHDVREIERPALIGLLRQATREALEPLKIHFPPVDEKTGVQQPFRTAQLQGISLANALEIKDQSLFAAAVVLAQLKLEPDMPAIDRAHLTAQLTNVNRVLSRARDLEPLAKAAQIRTEQERKAAEEKARRDAAIAAQKHPPAK